MKKFTLFVVLFLGYLLSTFARPKQTFVLVHGAWGGGWAWKKVDSLLTNKKHQVYRVTLTGLGERSHLLSDKVSLDTHIQDVVNTILFENLHNVVLLGHSYGGAVITGVMDRIPDRIARVIYVDAHLPQDGEAIYDYFTPERKASFATMQSNGKLMPNWGKEGTPLPHDVPHPANTLSEKLTLKNPLRLSIPATYIFTVENTQKPEADNFYKQSLLAQKLGYHVITLQADHNPQVSMPKRFYKLLLQW
jgi:pimeloyl-ACP methyl ester carboxylesterase